VKDIPLRTHAPWFSSWRRIQAVAWVSFTLFFSLVILHVISYNSVGTYSSTLKSFSKANTPVKNDLYYEHMSLIKLAGKPAPAKTQLSLTQVDHQEEMVDAAISIALNEPSTAKKDPHLLDRLKNDVLNEYGLEQGQVLIDLIEQKFGMNETQDHVVRTLRSMDRNDQFFVFNLASKPYLPIGTIFILSDYHYGVLLNDGKVHLSFGGICGVENLKDYYRESKIRAVFMRPKLVAAKDKSEKITPSLADSVLAEILTDDESVSYFTIATTEVEGKKYSRGITTVKDEGGKIVYQAVSGWNREVKDRVWGSSKSFSNKIEGTGKIVETGWTSLPKGIYSNNPGNMKYSISSTGDHKIDRSYLTRIGSVGFLPLNRGGTNVVFDSADNGIRACVNLIRDNYYCSGKKTIISILQKYAPAEENSTWEYAAWMASKLGVSMYDDLKLFDEFGVANVDQLLPYMKAKIRYENGRMPYSNAQIRKAIYMASMDHIKREQKGRTTIPNLFVSLQKLEKDKAASIMPVSFDKDRILVPEISTHDNEVSTSLPTPNNTSISNSSKLASPLVLLTLTL
jgi:hypothetical protein